MDEEAKKYYIPGNFIDESRSIRGMVKTRNLVEALVLGGIVAALLMLIPIETRVQRISVTIGVAGPVFVLGLCGINGDSTLYFLKLAINWMRRKSVMLFNENTRPQSSM